MLYTDKVFTTYHILRKDYYTFQHVLLFWAWHAYILQPGKFGFQAAAASQTYVIMNAVIEGVLS